MTGLIVPTPDRWSGSEKSMSSLSLTMRTKSDALCRDVTNQRVQMAVDCALADANGERGTTIVR
jgi:hypothetical protein